MKKALSSIAIPTSYNYIGVFLTFNCHLRCSYCINHEASLFTDYKELSGQEWIDGLNRISTRSDLPITLQGGEPTLHPDFYTIVNGIDKSINLDLLTNGLFNVQEFMDKVSPDRFKRKSPYASIRISYHLEQMDLVPTINKVKTLLNKGYSVGVWIVDHPQYVKLIKLSKDMMLREGIDCRLKEFLGWYRGKQYGTYRYPDAVNGQRQKRICKPSELLLAPDGGFHRCHYELYSNMPAYGNILSDNMVLLDDFRSCNSYGKCNSCDIKLKTNRFQEYGHCSVEVEKGGVV